MSDESRAFAARVAQKLAEPARAILGYQELAVEEVRESGPADALPSFEKVLKAARELNALLDRLLAQADEDAAPDAEARLRHDLRTPMNAIIGYSEMVVEEFADELPARLSRDIASILGESRALLAQIDGIVDFSRLDIHASPDTDDAMTMAAELARTLAARPAMSARATGRILVIDDVESNRDLLARRLGRDGHAVTTAASAQAALEILERQEFDLALVDILMPDMNGIELLGRLKGDERWREMPVIMVSGLKEDDAVIRCIAAGAEDYLPKPADPVLLRARIAAGLERRLWREREKHYLAQIEFERTQVNGLLDAILPVQVVRRIAKGEDVIADRFDCATIIFADIVDFTALAARTPPAALVQRLGALFSRFDELADQHGIEKIKTIGDAYMAAAGLPDPRPDHADAAIGFARALMDEVAASEDKEPLALRIGIHSGPVVAGLIGHKRFVYDVWGHTVNLASRLESYGAPGRIQISEATLDALRVAAAVEPRGELSLRGVGNVTAFWLA